MDDFEAVYARLNAAQKQAVDEVDGPVLVIAGPGTGKTQLLSARVANILKVTDTPPHNILCLTFTENGAENMRERLSRFIGQAAYEVTISTYHAFGGDLIRRYPEYFQATRQQNPVDDLGKREILTEITEQMSYKNPLKQTRHHLGDLMSTISEVKRALLTPDKLREIAKENLDFINAARPGIQEIFADFTTMPRSLAKALPFFEQTLQLIIGSSPVVPASPYGSLASLMSTSLESAIAAATESNKTSPLTTWKNEWLAKDTDNHFILSGELENARIRALATAVEQYESALLELNLYDFDDMILRSITALEKHADLRYSLQERYMYILLDEFQDTNAAQLKLIELLTDNPVNEGRPNVMAVGDDDQAIYAFQGAQYSNMRDFYDLYKDVLVVNLTENYRSHEQIITTAQNIAGQIESRLSDTFPGLTKNLRAANDSIRGATIERVEFLSAIAERHWMAERIDTLIKEGIKPSEIAVLAPKHKFLEPLVPYLNELHIPVRYEKRENILEAPVIRQLLTMARLVLALEADNQALANHLWPQVLSYDFWQLPIADVWQVSWQVSDSSRSDHGAATWSSALLDTPRFRLPVLLMLTIAAKLHSETLETMMDYLIGNAAVKTNDPDMPEVLSPLRDYYTGPQMQEEDPEIFYETVSHITVLRARLQDYQQGIERTLDLRDLIRYVSLYEEAGQQIINTSPYSQQADAVQLMTVYKAKGLEFKHVFLPECQDDVWGSSARDNSNKITLPANLSPIRHAGVSEDERLRILFVALTRAREGLYLSSATQTYSGRPIKWLKYFDERPQADGTVLALALPENSQLVRHSEEAAPELALLETDWRTRHLLSLQEVDLRGLLAERIDRYQISPTHLTDFINLEYAGPQRFFFKTILRFPETPLPDAQFGTAVHETMQWIQHRVNDRGSVPPARDASEYFKSRLVSKHLTEHRTALLYERGVAALHAWLKYRAHIFKPGDVSEKNFYNEGVFVDDMHLSGQVDRLEIDENTKSITVVDYKTGKPHERWTSDPRLHRYRMQLACYKLLIEHSSSYRGYSVPKGRIEFIEPDESGKVHALELDFKEDDMELAKDLLSAVWRHVHELNFPDVSHYPATAAGIKSFETDLLSGDI